MSLPAEPPSMSVEGQGVAHRTERKPRLLDEWRRGSDNDPRQRSPSLLDQWRYSPSVRAQRLANHVSTERQPNEATRPRTGSSSYHHSGLTTALISTAVAGAMVWISVKLLATAPIFM